MTIKFLGYKQDALKQHNVYRAIHDAPPMKLKRDLNKAAVQYARELFDIGKLVHSKWESRQGQGENLAAGCKSSSAKEGMSVEGAVRAWYVK